MAFSDDVPEFFRIFIPKFSSEKMGIPTSFVRKYILRVPKLAVVKDGSGKCWQVSLVTIGKNLYIGTGWEEFARDHSLERGDFLVFKYYKTSLFEVKIFGANGCKKQVASPQILAQVKIEDEEEQTHTKSSQALEQTRIEERGLNGSTRKSGSSEEISQGKISRKVAKTSLNEQRKVAKTSLNEQRTPRPAKHIAGKNLHFVANITDSETSKSGVYIPRAIMSETKMKPNVTLRDQNNKLWPVEILFLKFGRGFIKGGWPEFRSENNLKLNDKCVFEPVLGDENVCREIKVRVIRRASKCKAYPSGHWPTKLACATWNSTICCRLGLHGPQVDAKKICTFLLGLYKTENQRYSTDKYSLSTPLKEVARSKMAGPPRRVSFSNENVPEFFRVFIPEFSSKHMLIPPAFVRRFMPTIPEKAVVKDGSGKCWEFGLVTSEKDLYFATGWEEFARELFLETGDFLVFKYNGISLFEVEIFGKNGCKKVVVASPQCLALVKIEEEKTLEEPSNAYNRTQNEEIKGLNGSSKKSSSSRKHVAPKNNHFVVTLTKSRWGLRIPASVRKGIKFKPDVNLRCHKDKLWPMKISFWKDGRCYLTTGWSKFQKENKLEAKDKCELELVLGKEKICEEIKFQIIRGGARTQKY
ncbi:B3 DNA binding domain containing protein [Trema orientale]|uniref:B3 DNA binding domain containing protein n=1 Tax=Trema orientale TaxID=63057 RepID=A0A2P5FY27_TREOI|nr:B3 DNA binding domain containing protein [Trema orientale]